MVVVLVDNSYGPGGPGVVLAGVLVVLVGNSYGPGGPWVVLAGLLVVLVDICMVPVVLGGLGCACGRPQWLPLHPTTRGANVVRRSLPPRLPGGSPGASVWRNHQGFSK